MLRIERKDYENARKHGHRVCTAESIETSLRIAMKYEPLDKDTCERVFDMLQNAPVFDPEELRPKGEWVERRLIVFDDELTAYRCSNCKLTNEGMSMFCPNCGADMRGAGDATD